MLCWMKDLVSCGKQRANQKNKTNVPLQVRSPFQKDKWFSAQKRSGEYESSRAFPFTSLMRARFATREKFTAKKGCRSLNASLTLEASLVLPLLIFASVCLMLPARIMMTERKMQAGLESVGEELSQ